MINTGTALGGFVLSPLPEIASTDLHFVADDWSGSGSWTSRDNNAWVATIHGAPTKAATSQFPGRTEISGFVANSIYFSLASSTAHALNADLTIEAIVTVDDSSSGQPFYYGTIDSAGVAGDIFLSTFPGDHHYYIEPYDSGGTRRELTGPVVTSYANKYALITVTITQGANASKVYINGSTNSVSGTVGTYTSGVSRPLYLGGSPSGKAWGKAVVEIMRHTAILDAATIAARAAQFNAMKGY